MEFPTKVLGFFSRAEVNFEKEIEEHG